MFDIFNGVNNLITNIIVTIIEAIFKSIMAPFMDVHSFYELVYGTADGIEYWGVFTEVDLSMGFLPIYNIVLSLAVLIMVIFIAINGMRISSSGYSPTKRSVVYSFFGDLILVALVMFHLPELYSAIFKLNYGVIEMFAMDGKSNIFKMDVGLGENTTLESDVGLIGKLLIQLVIIGLGIWANMYYLMRKMTLIILMGLGPLMVVFWLLPQFKPITITWAKEFIGTVFIQGIHAFLFYIVAIISMSFSNGAGLIPTLICYLVFIPLAEQVRGLFGLGGNMTGALSRAGTMIGLSALGALAGTAKGALQGEGVMKSLSALKSGGAKAVKDIASGKNIGEVAKDLGRSAKDGFINAKNEGMFKAGDIVSKGGRAAFGLAGTFIGAPMGPAGSIAGAAIGSGVGGAVGGFTGRVGSAAYNKLKGNIDDGKNAVAEAKKRTADEAMVAAIATGHAASWAQANKDSVMADLRQQYPTASQEELENKFAERVAEKRNGYVNKAKASWDNAKTMNAKRGNGTDLANSAASAMTDAWAEKNQDSFMNEWESQNPRNTGESEKAYKQRGQQAFQNKKGAIKDSLMNRANSYIRDFSDANGIVDREGLADSMAHALGNNQKIDPNALSKIGLGAMSAVAVPSMIGKSGVPDISKIANNLAAAKVTQEKGDFIEEQIQNGATKEQAQANWRKEAPKRMSNYVQSYGSPEMQEAIHNAQLPKSGALQTMGTFIKGATASDLKTMSQGIQLIKNAVSDGNMSLKQSIVEGKLTSAVPNAVKAANTSIGTQLINNSNGDAIQLQESLVQKAGTVGGMLLGRAGMVHGHKMMNYITNSNGIGELAQTQVSSASEIIQMAHKIPNQDGEMQIAPGAVQHVTTRDGSYVQVKTSSGETRTVSVMGAGNETLKQGQVVYQDLTSSDGSTLEIAQVGRTGSSTYMMDSGGGRVATNHAVQNPMSLIGNGTSPIHQEVQRAVPPMLNERIDTGNYHVEDFSKQLSSGQLTNPRVVTNKAEQYLVADNENGGTVRVSPIVKGDARMASNETIEIPISISNGRIVPQESLFTSDGSLAAVSGVKTTMPQATVTQTVDQTITLPNGTTSTRTVVQPKTQILVDSNGENIMPNTSVTEIHSVSDRKPRTTSGPTAIPYTQYNNHATTGKDLDFDNLLPSRDLERARVNVRRRNVIDSVRKKQGATS